MELTKGTQANVICVFLGALFFLVLSNTSYAETLAVFGPKQYVKPFGKSVTHVDSFRIPENVKNCNLWLKNGKNDKDMVKDFSVYVNGNEVINSSNLKKRNAPITVVIPEKQNTIRVLLRGDGSGFLTIGVVGEKQDRKNMYIPPPRLDPGLR